MRDRGLESVVTTLISQLVPFDGIYQTLPVHRFT